MSAADLGYFGPDSVTWRVHREPALLVGGLRALLLQALHPQAMRLLHARSRFQDDPWLRLARTAAFVATVSFAPKAEVDAAAAHVLEVHAALGVDDPDQLAWVHACEVDSFLGVAQASGVPLSAADADRYLAEQVRSATLVGVPASAAPRTVAELKMYFAKIRSRLAATPEAFEAARYILVPPMPVSLPWRPPARVGWTAMAALAVGLLPGWARRLYRLPPLPGCGVATSATLRGLRAGTVLVPDRWRYGPAYRAALARMHGVTADPPVITDEISSSEP